MYPWRFFLDPAPDKTGSKTCPFGFRINRASLYIIVFWRSLAWATTTTARGDEYFQGVCDSKAFIATHD